MDFTIWYGLDTTKTLDAIDLGQSTKNKYGHRKSVKINIEPYIYVYRILHVNVVDWKPLVGLTSHFDMTLIPLRPRMYWFGAKPRLAPQQFEY